ncbi:hypothetical protein AO398_14920 [Methylobacterium sp. GXS13]|jgi:hypothetical protein|uniref:hypothetical protein n=1 Tax=unclassified Methylobacterium TaxID=2615210 RepID=UPI00071BD55B|nr:MULTISPECIES: hypothetical protein [unclassified Methylobacterium]KST60261.1 hypothetical protein AO398_14920 [Methylobacterium sp. GXS13]MCJ2116653.1 hypothetical protein [Methylobacterium sp. J-001]
MANRRALSWSAALRDLKDDRTRRQDVREERLKTTAGLRGTPALPLSAWRGRSGRRYVVGVHPAGAFDLEEMAEAVVIAVRRDDTGIAEMVSVATSNESPRDHLRRTWLDRVRTRGATELHVHRLADDAAERVAIVNDLQLDTIEPAQA